MLEVVLQILSVAGIILLVLLGLILAIILLVLFFPFSYKFSGEGNGRNFSLDAKADWLFGLLRVRFAYPDPGKLTVKVLWFTIFDSEQDETHQQEKPERQDKGREPQEVGEQETPEEQEIKKESQEINPQEDSPAPGEGGRDEGNEEKYEEEPSESKKNLQISEIVKKIRYTICSTYDKIKKIRQNITYYVEILQDRETRLLFLHVKSRVWKILKSIRPRKLRAQILFGTGSPDTTGYAYGVYGMLLPLLGPDVIVTPDFCQAVLEGSFYAAGHITVAVLLWHTIKVLLDKRLRQFVDKLKHKERDESGKDRKGRKGAKRKKKRQEG